MLKIELFFFNCIMRRKMSSIYFKRLKVLQDFLELPQVLIDIII